MLPQNFTITQAVLAELISTAIMSPYSLFQAESTRLKYCSLRLEEAKRLGYIQHNQDSEYNIKNTVRHNLESLDPQIAARRPWALLGPLLGIDHIQRNINNLKVLIIGPRTEAEILLYVSMGFSPENIKGLDLITYSDFIVKGDMHEMPFEENSFDVVIFSWVLGYSTNQQKAVKEAIKITKNEGYIGIGEQWDPTPIQEVSRQMLESKGYSLDGVATRSCSDLNALFENNLTKVIFSTEPIDSEKNSVGWITTLVQINK